MLSPSRMCSLESFEVRTCFILIGRIECFEVDFNLKQFKWCIGMFTGVKVGVGHRSNFSYLEWKSKRRLSNDESVRHWSTASHLARQPTFTFSVLEDLLEVAFIDWNWVRCAPDNFGMWKSNCLGILWEFAYEVVLGLNRSSHMRLYFGLRDRTTFPL